MGSRDFIEQLSLSGGCPRTSLSEVQDGSRFRGGVRRRGHGPRLRTAWGGPAGSAAAAGASVQADVSFGSCYGEFTIGIL
jgi:hypothetical protein